MNAINTLESALGTSAQMPALDGGGEASAARNLGLHGEAVVRLLGGQASRFRDLPNVRSRLGAMAGGAERLQPLWIVRVTFGRAQGERRIMIIFGEARAQEAAAEGTCPVLAIDDLFP